MGITILVETSNLTTYMINFDLKAQVGMHLNKSIELDS